MPRLILATEAQKRERDALTHAAWGDRLELDAWLRREQALRGHPWAARAMQTWILQAEGSALSSCETFRMEGWFDGVPGSVYGIASVFTEPALRGRGHARRMLAALHRALRERDPEAGGALLFSEVGPTLYQSVGYRGVETRVRVLAASPATTQVRWVDEGQLAPTLAAIPRPPGIVVWPTADQLDWHLERQRFYAGALGRVQPPAAGARCGAGAALWAADYRNERLAVLVGSAPDAGTGDRLLEAAAHAAAAAGLREVHLWESPWLPATVGAVRPLEDLPMIRWFDETAGLPVAIPRALWV